MKENDGCRVSHSMMPLPIEYQKTALYAGIIISAFIGAFALQAILPSTFAAASEALNSVAQTSSGTVYLDGEAAPASTAANAPAQLTIADNGFIHIGGARVSAVHEGSITARLAWSSAQLTWQIDSSSAKFYGQNGEALDAASIRIGDVVSVSGTITGSSKIDAQYIRVLR
jgi:hypothetical protein